MGRFQMTDGAKLDNICIDNTPRPDGKPKLIRLQYAGLDDIAFSSRSFIEVVQYAGDKRRKITPFTIEPRSGASGKAYIYGKNGDYDDMLGVTVGRVTNHDNFTADLFAELLGRSENPKKLKAYQRALDFRNNDIPSDQSTWDGKLADQPLKQITNPDTPNKWNCGGALQQFGNTYFGKISSGEPTLYYNRPKSGSESDIRAAINTARLRTGVERIRGLLDRKTPVRVFVAHHYPVSVTQGRVAPTGRTHYLTIIGYKQDKFLCIDPWPGGMRLDYQSGIFGTCKSAFMGTLRYDGQTLESPPMHAGVHDYLVIAGP